MRAVDDYIQLQDGRTGIVRELNMRSTTLETFDGKDVMVPNEKFIVPVAPHAAGLTRRCYCTLAHVACTEKKYPL